MSEQISHLYATQKFDALEQAMAGPQHGERRFIDGSSYSDAVYVTFRGLTEAQKYSEWNKIILAHWEKAKPGSAYLQFAKARFAYAEAWSIRGNQYSASKESWELFQIGLRNAEKILLDAPQSVEKTPIAARMLLAISLDMRNPSRPPKEIFTEAVEHWPLEFGFYQLMLSRIVPKWGGSWKQVDDFMQTWSKQLATKEGKSLYARLQIGLLRTVDAEETPLHWDLLGPSFEDLVTRYPSSDYRNFYASFACFVRDKVAFASAMQKMAPNERMDSAWLPGHSYQACLRWAGV